MDELIRTKLLQVLETIEYKEDKEAFIQNFLELIERQTRSDLIKSLPQEKQTTIIQELTTEKELENIKQIFNKYFEDVVIEKAIVTATQNTFDAYIKAISAALSLDKKKKLEELVSPSIIH